MRIVQYLPDNQEDGMAGLGNVLSFIDSNFSKITITKEKLTEKDWEEIFGESRPSEYLSTIAKYIIEVK